MNCFDTWAFVRGIDGRSSAGKIYSSIVPERELDAMKACLQWLVSPPYTVNFDLL